MKESIKQEILRLIELNELTDPQNNVVEEIADIFTDEYDDEKSYIAFKAKISALIEHTARHYTEVEIRESLALYTDSHSDKKNLKPYVTRETDNDGNVISFYFGLEDENGRPVTGFNEVHHAKA